MAAEVISSGNGAVNKAGTFTPDPPPGPRLNPYEDAGAFGKMEIGGLRLPGVIVSIDGADKPEEWNAQKGTGSSGATSVWKGTKLAESIKVTLALYNAASFHAYYDVRDTLRPKLGAKPPSLVLVNPVVNFAGVSRVACANVGAPKWVASGGYWTGEVTLIEYNPSKPTNAGPAGAAANGAGKANEPDPNADVKALVEKKLEEAEKLG